MIDEDNIAQTLARVLPQATILSTDAAIDSVVHVAVPQGQAIQPIDLEQYLANPRRKKGTASFTNAASFTDYVKEHRIDGTTAWCKFDPQTFALSFVAVINDHAGLVPTGNPDHVAGWRDHRATFSPEMSAEWKVWKGKNANAFAQVAFAEFIEANAEDLTQPPGKEGYPTDLAMLTMATNFVANEDRRLKSTVRLSSGGVRLEYIADPDAGTVQSMEMFSKFAIGIPVFHGGSAWAIEARLKYRLKDGAVHFFYELVRPDRSHEQAALALIEDVRSGLGDVPLLMGAFA